MDFLGILGNLLFWIPPLVVAIYCGGIVGIIAGIMILIGEAVVVFVICMFWEWFTYDGRND